MRSARRLVRSLHAAYKERPDGTLYGQIRNLRTRLDDLAVHRRDVFWMDPKTVQK